MVILTKYCNFDQKMEILTKNGNFVQKCIFLKWLKPKLEILTKNGYFDQKQKCWAKKCLYLIK